LPKQPTERDREKGVFDFTSLRVWRRIFPAALELERYLDGLTPPADERSKKRLAELGGALSEALENLVRGYYQFKGEEKAGYYHRSRVAAGRALYLLYHLGFSGAIEKNRVLESGEAFKDSIVMINSLIKSVMNKTPEIAEEWRLIKSR
jgi:hypothetical protein